MTHFTASRYPELSTVTAIRNPGRRSTMTYIESDVSTEVDANVTPGSVTGTSDPDAVCGWSQHNPTLHVIHLHSPMGRSMDFEDNVDFAAELINNSSDILPGYQIHVHHKKSDRVRLFIILTYSGHLYERIKQMT